MNTNSIKLSFWGGAREITGSNFLIETPRKKILIDCGLFQGTKKQEKRSWNPFSYNPSKIDAVLITHAHLDHIGRLPKLIRDGFRGKIFATPPTIDLTKISLEDAYHLHKERAQVLGLEPAFDEDDLNLVFKYFSPIEYGKEVKLGRDISFEFFNAGHILGSSLVKIQIRNPKYEIPNKFKIPNSKFKTNDYMTIVFTGDLGNWPVPIMYPPEFISEADYLVIESTYGSRTHEAISERKEKVERAIEDTVSAGGTLMIPSFALERTQELLFELNELVENRRVPRIPIFLDSPMAIKVTEVYKKYPNYYNPKAVCLVHCGDDFFKFPGLKITKTTAESKKINDVPPPKVIIAGSGMMSGGRILHHLKRYLSDPNSYLLIISYQAEGTLGRQIFNIRYGKNQKQKEVKIKIFGEDIPVRCRIRAVSAYSSHADQGRLREFIEHIRKLDPETVYGGLKKVFVVHGEMDSLKSFSQLIKDHLGISTSIPKFGEEFILR